MAADLFTSPYTGPTGFPSTDCTPTVPTATSFSTCPDAYTTHEGEIDRLWICNVVKDGTTGQWEPVVTPVDHTDPGAGGLGVTGIAKFIGFGDKPLAEVITVPLPTRSGRLKTVDRRHTLNFTITDMSIVNYDAIRELQGSQYVCIWYGDIDGRGYGGALGIIARVVNAGNVSQRGEQVLLEGQITLEWMHLFDPPTYAMDQAAQYKVGKIKTPEPLKGKAAPKEASELTTA